MLRSQAALGAFAVVLAIACAGLDSCSVPVQILPFPSLDNQGCRVDAVKICDGISKKDVMQAADREAALKQHRPEYVTLTTTIDVPEGPTIEVVCSYTVAQKKVAYAHAWAFSGGHKMDLTPQSGIVGDTQDAPIPPLGPFAVAYLSDRGFCSNIPQKGRHSK